MTDHNQAERAAPEPLPCPFCGESDQHFANEHQSSYVTCLACNAVGPVVIGGDQLANAAWNRRAHAVGEDGFPPLQKASATVIDHNNAAGESTLDAWFELYEGFYTAEQVRQAQREAYWAGMAAGKNLATPTLPTAPQANKDGTCGS